MKLLKKIFLLLLIAFFTQEVEINKKLRNNKKELTLLSIAVQQLSLCNKESCKTRKAELEKLIKEKQENPNISIDSFLMPKKKEQPEQNQKIKEFEIGLQSYATNFDLSPSELSLPPKKTVYHTQSLSKCFQFYNINSCNSCCKNNLNYDQKALDCCIERCTNNVIKRYSLSCMKYHFKYQNSVITILDV